MKAVRIRFDADTLARYALGNHALAVLSDMAAREAEETRALVTPAFVSDALVGRGKSRVEANEYAALLFGALEAGSEEERHEAAAALALIVARA
jgi:hypothetical protein